MTNVSNLNLQTARWPRRNFPLLDTVHQQNEDGYFSLLFLYLPAPWSMTDISKKSFLSIYLQQKIDDDDVYYKSCSQCWFIFNFGAKAENIFHSMVWIIHSSSMSDVHNSLQWEYRSGRIALVVHKIFKRSQSWNWKAAKLIHTIRIDPAWAPVVKPNHRASTLPRTIFHFFISLFIPIQCTSQLVYIVVWEILCDKKRQTEDPRSSGSIYVGSTWAI